MDRDVLLALSKDDLIALILAQAAQISALTARVADLEAKLGAPPKTPDNSSLPSSKGQKVDCPDCPKTPRRDRPGIARALAENLDHVVEATLAAWPHCTHPLAAADQPDRHAYDRIELPPIRPVVTRIHRPRGVCPCWRKRVAAPAPEGFAPGSPFGPGLCALVIRLHVIQAIGFERLARLLAQVFGLTLPLDALASGSEGATANILARAEAPLLAATAPIAAAVRASSVAGCEETSARVAGQTWWQWVLLGSTALCHLIAGTRAACVVTALDGARPAVWVADRPGGQLGHGAVRQRGLAHRLRDATYAVEDGDEGFAPAFASCYCRLWRSAGGETP